LCWLYFWLYTSVVGVDLPKTARLKRENARGQARIQVMNRQLDLYEQTLSGIEERDDHVYRSIFGMNEVPREARNAGFGNPARYALLERQGADPALGRTMRRLDNLSKRTYVQSLALDEVHGIAINAGDMVSHIPAVPPVLPDKRKVHLSSPFGYRTDPVYGGRRFHSGQDFAADRGYPVYATGDGVVETVRFQLSGYGNEVVINHGFGYKTRYAHLHTTEVAPGMSIRRGDPVGTVGRSGKATGPHLHYEVLYKGDQVNPYGFMDMDMSVEEYQAMVGRRREESAQRRKSSMELMNRKRSAR
jgi:murein DD-endopeptidase MepM/ murein hydrolase activator NlpD